MAELSKTIEDLCHPYCLYSDMMKAGVKTAKVLGVTDMDKALGAAAAAVLPEMYANLERRYADFPYNRSSFVIDGTEKLEEAIKRVEGVSIHANK